MSLDVAGELKEEGVVLMNASGKCKPDRFIQGGQNRRMGEAHRFCTLRRLCWLCTLSTLCSLCSNSGCRDAYGPSDLVHANGKGFDFVDKLVVRPGWMRSINDRLAPI